MTLAPEKMSLISDTLDNNSTNQHSAIKYQILNSTDQIRKNKKRADLNVITKHILRTEVSNFDQDFIETMISELIDQNLIENKRTPQGLDSFRRVPSISPEEEEVLCSPLYGKCNIFPQSIETDSI